MGESWRKLSGVALVACVASVPALAQAPAPDPQVAACMTDADICTAAIQSGRYSGRPLAELHQYRAEAEERDGKHDDAIADYTQAITIEPRASFYEARGRAQEAKGRREQAIADFREALRLEPNGDAAYEIARIGWRPASADPSDDALSRRIDRDAAAQYASLTTTFTALLGQSYGAGDNNLAHCTSGSEYLGSAEMGFQQSAADWRFSQLADLAYDIVVWRRQLQSLRYPATVWAPIVLTYEAQRRRRIVSQEGFPPPSDAADDPAQVARDRADDTFYHRLLPALATYRNSHPALHLARVIADSECGAEQDTLEVTTQPSGGVVMLIPMFFYKLCQVEGLDPDDPARCDRWREIFSGIAEDVEGNYAYQVRWPDGATRRGRLNLAQAGRNGPIVLTKP
jgi:tetratricopeptide (TPR) repeat protein